MVLTREIMVYASVESSAGCKTFKRFEMAVPKHQQLQSTLFIISKMVGPIT